VLSIEDQTIAAELDDDDDATALTQVSIL